MIGASASTSPVTRLRATSGTNSYGDPAEVWTATTRARLYGAIVQPAASVEGETVTADRLENERTLYVLRAVDLLHTDRIEAEGVVWRVDGTPFTRRGLASGSYVRAVLKRVTSR